MLLERLRTETREAHDRIEHDLGLTTRPMDKAGYRNLLERFYGFYSAWETEASAMLADEVFFNARRKLPLLKNDLEALDVPADDLERLPICTSLMPLTCKAEVWGAMYVVEGSTLGGQIIARHVESSLGLHDENGCAFFRSYGQNIGAMWRSFRDRLTAFSNPETDDIVVRSASRTFERMNAWLCKGV